MIIIQDQIKITKKEYKEYLKHYEDMSDSFSMGINSWSGGKKEILKEVRDVTDTGKKIMLMRYHFLKFLEFEKKDREKSGSDYELIEKNERGKNISN